MKCPKCGSTNVQITAESKKLGCLWLFLFGIFYAIWCLFKLCIGIIVFVVYDWWMAIVHSKSGKGHVWQCGKWLTGKKKKCYCHECGHNFTA